MRESIAMLNLRAREECGVALPVVLMVVVAVTVLVAVAVGTASVAQSQSRRDVSYQRALDAAEAATQAATYRLNRFQPNANTLNCVTGTDAQLVSVTNAWCPAQSIALDDDASAIYRVSSQYNTGDRYTRVVTAVGMSNCNSETDSSSRCVRRRLAVTLRYTPSQFGSGTAVYSGGSIQVRDDNNIEEAPNGLPCPSIGTVATSPATSYNADGYCGARVVAKGSVSFANRPSMCGYLTMLNDPAALYMTGNTSVPNVPAGCLGAPINPATGQPSAVSASPAPFRDPSGGQSTLVRTDTIADPPAVTLPQDVVASSGNCRLSALFGTSGACANTGVDADQLYNRGSSTWDPVNRALIVRSNTTLTLKGGTYVFCYLEARDGILDVHTPANGTPAVIYIADPTDSSICPGGGSGSTGAPLPALAENGNGDINDIGWGSVVLHGNGRIVNHDGNPGMLDLMVAGTASRTNDKVRLEGSSGRMQLGVYAPRSRFEITAQSAGIVRVVAQSVLISGNYGVEWNDAANEPWPLNPTTFLRQTWYECPAVLPNSEALTTAADPTAGCNPA